MHRSKVPSPIRLAMRTPSLAHGRPRGFWRLVLLLALAGCSGSDTVQPTPAVTLDGITLPPGVVGAAYDHTLSASGGDGSFAWSVSSGSLPPGLRLTPAGALAGTPTAAGTSDFTVRVVSADQSATAPLRIVVVDPLELTTEVLSVGRTGTPYSQTLAATGGTGSYSWSVASGGLPGGLTLDAAGVLSGTPVAADVRDVTIQVESGHQTVSRVLSLAIFNPLEVATTGLPEGIVGVLYSRTFDAGGGAGPYRWRLSDGALPDGIAMDTTGVLSGTPASSGTASFTVEVESGDERASRTFQLAVVDPLVVATPSLPSVAVGVDVDVAMGATGGTGDYRWSVAAGELPPGLTLSEAGRLEGTATTPGIFAFTVRVLSGSQSASRPLELRVVEALTITTESLPAAITGASYSQTLESLGGAEEAIWSISSGSLPTGLALSAGGTISGTPTAAGEAEFTVQAAADGQTASRPLSIRVFDPLVITTSGLPDGVVDETYGATLDATGGTGEVIWSLVSGALPESLVLAATGEIGGVPTEPGSTTLEVRAESGLQSATAELEITIFEGLTLSATPLAAGEVGVPYSESVTATGGTGSYSYSLLSGELPSGTSLTDSTGTISGMPSEARDFTFTIQVTSGSQTDDGQFTITVDPETCSLASLPDTDGDRLPDCAETNDGVFVGATQAGTDPADPDTDGDGIPDGDEVLGTLDGLDLPAMGTNPLQQNILIEYDWFDDAEGSAFHSHRPSASTIAKVAAVFAAAPIDNPDGSTGIVAIQDYGQGDPFTGGALVADPDGCLVSGVAGSEYAGYASENFAANRLGYFHYSLVIHRYNAEAAGSCDGASGSSGQAFYNDHRSIVSSSTWHNSGPGDQWVANTIVHEVGHNLNLTHGGSFVQAGLNYKPNYNSVMNYRYQFSGVDTGCDVTADNFLDFSRGTRITLDESSVDEALGVCGVVAIDWNDDGDESGTGLSLDLQAYDRGAGSASPNGSATDVLEDYDDWANITLASSVAGAPLPGGVSAFKDFESCTSAPPIPGGR